MCLLALCVKKTIPKENFDESYKCNRDGFGMAWRESGKIAYMKGYMTVEEAWKAYTDFTKAKIFPHVIHFRLGTPTLNLLTHPFEITHNSDLKLQNLTENNVLFHNGVVGGWKDRMWETFTLRGSIPDGKLIDTRVIAILMSYYGDKVFEFIDGKWIIFGPKRLTTIGDFVDDDGILYSNTSYKVVRHNYSSNNRQGNLITHYDNNDTIQIDEFVI